MFTLKYDLETPKQGYRSQAAGGAGGLMPPHFLGKNFKKEHYHLTVKNTELIYK